MKWDDMNWRQQADVQIARGAVEHAQGWREWSSKIPKIRWPADMAVSAVPPFAGALIRYFVEVDGIGFKSVYLDVWDALGAMGEPYWEVYPVRSECERVLMTDVDGLLALLRQPREGAAEGDA